MLIYFNGDSNVAGTELPEATHCMANQLARRFDGQYQTKFINDAVPGASNDLIYDQTRDFLNNPSSPKPDLVVIGWTQFNRVQWFLVDDWNNGRFWEINKIGVGIPVPDAYKERYQHYVNHAQYDGHWRLVQGSYWHNKIFNLHKLLEYKNIPHLFFNAFDEFILPEQSHHLEWDNRFMSPYSRELIYTDWCARKGYKEITPGWQHYESDAHVHWADEMYRHIKNNNIL
jgi:hypothetical protein